MSLSYDSPSSPAVDRTQLRDRVCLVTGAASGLGLTITQAFAVAEAYVVMVDIAPSSKGDEIVASLPNGRERIRYVQCDVTSWEDQVKAFKAAIEFSPTRTLDVVVACAGVAADFNLVDKVSDEQLNLDEPPEPPPIAPIQVNLIGVYYTSHLALHYFRLPPQNNTTHHPPQSKSLIFISSLVAYMDYDDTLYTASKYGVRGLFRSIRDKALQQQNVRCNNIAPWHLKTAQTAKLQEHFKARGLSEGKGLTFAKLETLVEAVVKCAVEEGVSGRSFAIMPEGYVDLKEDFEHGYGGPESTKTLQRRYDDGDQMYDPAKVPKA